MSHEDYTGYRHGRGTVNNAGRLQVDTAFATASRTVVDSPVVAIKEGLPQQLTPVRPKKLVNPYFVIEGDPDLVSDDVAALDSSNAEGKFVAEAAMNIDASEFTSQEINHLVDIMDNGIQSGWTNLDVWEDQ